MTMQYQVRDLELGDYHKGYLDLLSQFTTVGDITEEFFQKQVTFLKNRLDSYIRVIEDTSNNKIIATGTIYIEYKFIHKVGKVAHIEDLVIHKDYQNKGLGNTIIEHLKVLANAFGCYKVTLYCPDSTIPFFEKHGFKSKEKQMVIYYHQ